MPQGTRRADMDTFLKAQAKKSEWEYPDIDALKGKKFRGLTELRWKSDGIPHRILGCRIAQRQYLCLIGCTHNAKKYMPPDAMNSAKDRFDQIQSEQATYCEYQLITNN
jgi:hypothetical protein